SHHADELRRRSHAGTRRQPRLHRPTGPGTAMTARHFRQRGFSLVELAVALAIAALLTVLLVNLLPLGHQILEAERQQQELAQAEQALLGYMRSHGHLPGADADGNGRADGATSGWLPVADLGLP